MNKEHQTKNDVGVDYNCDSVAARHNFFSSFSFLSLISHKILLILNVQPSSASLMPIYRKFGHLELWQLAQAS